MAEGWSHREAWGCGYCSRVVCISLGCWPCKVPAQLAEPPTWQSERSLAPAHLSPGNSLFLRVEESCLRGRG